jgi:hypothetical protein
MRVGLDVNAAYVSAVVAGLAVIVGGVMQALTLRRAKENAAATVLANERATAMTVASSERAARLSALASATTVWEQGLREDIAEYATLSYEVEQKYKWAITHHESWPGEEWEKVMHEDVLLNRLLLRLNKDVPAEELLIDRVKAMRHEKEKEQADWSIRRDALVDAARDAFRARWSDNFTSDSQPHIAEASCANSAADH